jgi:hypothetical protein
MFQLKLNKRIECGAQGLPADPYSLIKLCMYVYVTFAVA